MSMSDDDLLGGSRSIAQFSQARPPPRDPRAMPRKAPARSPAVAPAKRTATSDFWCCLVLSFLALGGYGIWSVPSHDRSLNNFESKLRTVERALGGELEKENRGLTATLRSERQKETELHEGEETLRKQLAESRQQQAALQKKLDVKESNYESAQKDIIKTRDGLQSWHRKSDELRSKLGLVQLDADQKHKDLQRAHQETSKVEQRARQLEGSLAAARKQIAGLQASERRLRGQLQHEEHWREDTVEKLHRFKNAEDSLMKSVGIEAA